MMLPTVPIIDDYDISDEYGFLPADVPLDRLPDPYYSPWEEAVAKLQPLLLSKRLLEVVKKLPVLTTSKLTTQREWRRAYVVLCFLTHSYIWGGSKPEEVGCNSSCWPLLTIQRVPPPLAIPFLQVCAQLELPPVATYAGLCLWNFRPIFPFEPIDDLNNLSTLNTFTGSLDESWFYLVSVAIEARGGPIIPLMLSAIQAARCSNFSAVVEALHTFAERLDELGSLLTRMYENCDPHVFYHRIRPFLAGSKNMADAGLPNGVIFEDGSGTEHFQQFGGGSNAQSSLIQFFDIVLGVEHRPTGEKGPPTPSRPLNKISASDAPSTSPEGTTAPARHNFIQDMRSYMPGPHRRFLGHVSSVANIREFVESNRSNRHLCIAYDACLAMLRALRDKHIQLVSRYIIVKSRESRSHSRGRVNRNSSSESKVDHPSNGSLHGVLVPPRMSAVPSHVQRSKGLAQVIGKKNLRGTGGTALIPFLKQARDETGEPAIDAWARRLLSNGPADSGPKSRHKGVALGKMGEHADGEVEIVGLAGSWSVDDSEGGLCHW